MLNLKVVHPFGGLGRAMEWGLPIVYSLSFPLRVSLWSEPSGCPGLGVTAVHHTDLNRPIQVSDIDSMENNQAGDSCLGRANVWRG